MNREVGDYMSKGERIRLRREQLNIGQTELAKRIGVSKQTLYKYETDIVTNIPSDKIEELAKALSTSPAYIMGWEDSEELKEARSRFVNDYVQNDKARQMFELYKQAPPEIQAAVEILLKSRQSDS